MALKLISFEWALQLAKSNRLRVHILNPRSSDKKFDQELHWKKNMSTFLPLFCPIINFDWGLTNWAIVLINLQYFLGKNVGWRGKISLFVTNVTLAILKMPFLPWLIDFNPTTKIRNAKNFFTTEQWPMIERKNLMMILGKGEEEEREMTTCHLLIFSLDKS